MSSTIDFILKISEPALQFLQFLVQISLLAALIYIALLYTRGTRAAPILLGIVIVTVVGWSVSLMFGLEEIEWLLSKIPALIAFVIIVIFQPELRRAFAEIGSNPHRLWGGQTRRSEIVDTLIETAYRLSEKKIGALIAIQRDIGMRAISDAGTKIDAPLSSELLVTIFSPNTPLHDGAVIIKDGVIISAGCFLPLTQSHISPTLGTRHRAAVGITEETDAVVVVVSEENGQVSLAHKTRLVRDVDKDRLHRHLTNYLVKQESSTSSAP